MPPFPSHDNKKQVIISEGEHKASVALRQASIVLNDSPTALQLRYLQTMSSISAEKNSTIVFPFPIDLFTEFMPKPNRQHQRGHQSGPGCPGDAGGGGVNGGGGDCPALPSNQKTEPRVTAPSQTGRQGRPGQTYLAVECSGCNGDCQSSRAYPCQRDSNQQPSQPAPASGAQRPPEPPARRSLQPTPGESEEAATPVPFGGQRGRQSNGWRRGKPGLERSTSGLRPPDEASIEEDPSGAEGRHAPTTPTLATVVEAAHRTLSMGFISSFTGAYRDTHKHHMSAEVDFKMPF
ncbi:unnamed protein product [Protopolystoma xenopodis]|uniref:Band 7 domain-containing protein n=1 Tax=Protopolystoma xenopodis TaxID=117903 RepID=A0A448XCZ0_9PLAT|nr:unnamed protein product [Protopolystoma xenopodis]